MDFRHLIVTCLFSMLRLSFETQKIKENYAIFIGKSDQYYSLYLWKQLISKQLESNCYNSKEYFPMFVP